MSVNGVTNGVSTTQKVDGGTPCKEIVIDVHNPDEYLWQGYIIIKSEHNETIVDIVGGEWGDELGSPYTASSDSRFAISS